MNTVDSENDSQTSGCHIKESDIRKEKFEENEQFVGNHVFAIATMVDNTLVLSHAEPVETEDDLVIVDAKVSWLLLTNDLPFKNAFRIDILFHTASSRLSFRGIGKRNFM